MRLALVYIVKFGSLIIATSSLIARCQGGKASNKRRVPSPIQNTTNCYAEFVWKKNNGNFLLLCDEKLINRNEFSLKENLRQKKKISRLTVGHK